MKWVRTAVLLLACGCALRSHPAPAVAWQSTIAFVNSRDDTSGTPFRSTEIYLMNADGTAPRRLTTNADGDAFPVISPDGRSVVFDSNRRRAPDAPLNTTELFLMDIDGANQRVLARGSSATWSPDGSRVAFHASASGRGQPIRRDPGAPATDSDLFLLNVRDALATGAQPTNLTNTPTEIEDDADWSPDGHRIVYTRHPVTDDPLNSSAAEIYVMLVDGSAEPLRLTTNGEEERAPSWSPDGHRIVYMCRHGGRDFEICVMNADGTGSVQLTDNASGDLSPDWSPDGTKIVFHRTGPGRFQLWMMNADGSGQVQLTQPPGMNAMANWHAGPQ